MNADPQANPSVARASSKRGSSYSTVLYAGVATSALALLGVYFLDVSADFHVMGWYADYILPIGALAVGLAASSGYGVASWFTGVKITKSLLWMVLGIQVLVYFAAQYIEFSHLKLIHRSTGKPVGFIEYYDLKARSFAWKNKNDDGVGEPMGIYGYFFRGLEILGFAGGSLIVPAALSKAPYCQTCRRYMRKRALSTIAGCVPVRKIKKSNTEELTAHQAEQEQAFARGKRIAEILQKMSAEGQTAEFQKTIAELEPEKKKAAKLPMRIIMELVSCKECQSGWLHSNLMIIQGKAIKVTEISRNDVTPEFVRAVLK